jgi:hypothetical protein
VEIIDIYGTFIGLIVSSIFTLLICRPKKADFSSLKQVAKVMANPLKTMRLHGKDVLLNGVVINSELARVFEAGKNKDFINMGRNIGQTFVDSIINVNGDEDLFLY